MFCLPQVLELSPCTCLLGPAADFADAAVGVDADVVDGEGAVGVGAVLGALARRPGRLERRRHRQLSEPVPEVLQSEADLIDLGGLNFDELHV